jgi:hypothetical protein
MSLSSNCGKKNKDSANFATVAYSLEMTIIRGEPLPVSTILRIVMKLFR